MAADGFQYGFRALDEYDADKVAAVGDYLKGIVRSARWRHLGIHGRKISLVLMQLVAEYVKSSHSQPMRTRQAVVAELFSTEEAYFESLKVASTVR